MLLCDIGNTNATFFNNGYIKSMRINDFKSFIPHEDVYYISVNDGLKQKLQSNNRFINLEPFYHLQTNYIGLGIDRMAACYYIDNGVIVDAGSAITIDLVKDKKHIGGFILPGITRSLETFKLISPRLDISLNSQINLESLPNRTADAVSYGIIKPIILSISDIVKDQKVYFTGGDGEFLSKFFKKAIFDRTLVFRSMQKLIKNERLL